MGPADMVQWCFGLLRESSSKNLLSGPRSDFHLYSWYGGRRASNWKIMEKPDTEFMYGLLVRLTADTTHQMAIWGYIKEQKRNLRIKFPGVNSCAWRSEGTGYYLPLSGKQSMNSWLVLLLVGLLSLWWAKIFIPFLTENRRAAARKKFVYESA